MATYDIFAPFYDAVQGDRAEEITYLGSLIERHHPRATTVLELACGTGSVMEQLEPRYELTGVDLSERMLELAAQKLPRARLLQADMARLDLRAVGSGLRSGERPSERPWPLRLRYQHRAATRATQRAAGLGALVR
jgi:SAM-dependent methyltransferase